MDLKVESKEYDITLNIDTKEARNQDDSEITVKINGVDSKEISTKQQTEDKDPSKYAHMNPWEIYQLCKDDPDFSRSWLE